MAPGSTRGLRNNPRNGRKRTFAATAARMLQPKRDRVRAELGLPKAQSMLGAGPGVKEQCHLVSGTFDLEVVRELPPNWHLTGPHMNGPAPSKAAAGGNGAAAAPGDAAIMGFLQEALEAGEPVVYVATGTLAQPNQRQVAALASAMRAVGGARFVWSLPQPCHALLPEGFGDWAAAGRRALVVAWAPQPAVLSHPATRLFVTHGGLNSIWEGLTGGLPLLVLPFFADQPMNAQHIANKGLGSQLDPWKLKGPAVARALTDLLADSGVAGRAAELGGRLRAQPGTEVAADALEGFARRTAAAAAAV